MAGQAEWVQLEEGRVGRLVERLELRVLRGLAELLRRLLSLVGVEEAGVETRQDRMEVLEQDQEGIQEGLEEQTLLVSQVVEVVRQHLMELVERAGQEGQLGSHPDLLLTVRLVEEEEGQPQGRRLVVVVAPQAIA